MKGRPKIPTQLKKLKGTEDKRWMLENEVKFDLVMGDNSDKIKLKGDALKIFSEVCEQLRKTGIMAEVDSELVSAYAQKLATYKQAIKMLEAEGEVITGEKGTRINPWFDVSERSLKQAIAIGVLFGITPSARARIPAQAAPASKLELLKKKIS
jgi:P27 family predicted phage terminase small subunit